ncbi:glycosyltransferase family 4 protein [Micromonospora olivasterospora]|uniref:Glycosyltransferase involved in cell wall biosynthesis n=1 Tax=Micromonospora olivasterospora TaxID=1880 RepID=A0A562IE52_MICOL|nr:glycosyltransferase family 4 protein [Micromonospora olivasterospora]TWH69299.1 glycosyltransferase involved in cell wall biosynthesis [Micromonospora olivasterospora]
MTTGGPVAPQQGTLDFLETWRRPVRVVHVMGCLDRGGIETSALDVCRAIPPDEVQQTFVTVAGWEGALAADFRAAGAAVRQLPVRPRRSFPLRMWQCLQSLRPDVVVSHISLTSALVLLAARAGGVPVRVARLSSEGDGRPDTRGRRAQRALLRRLLPHVATDVLGVTAAARDFAGVRPGDPRYRVLPNGVAISRVDGWDRETARRHWGLPPDAPVLGYLGRAAPEKNRAFLVEIHRAARALRPDARLLVAGPGGSDDITGPHPQVGADGRVVLAGEVDEIASVLAACDVLLLPSVREGLPGVILEALAAGVPVVATDLPTLRELATLVRGVVPVSLSAGADAWATVALRQAEMDADERRELSLSLRSSPFTLEHATREWRDLWRVTTGRNASPVGCPPIGPPAGSSGRARPAPRPE